MKTGYGAAGPVHHQLLSFPTVWLEPCPGKAAPKCQARAACSGSWEAMGERLPVSCGGGRSMRRSGGQPHVLNPERKSLGEQRMSRMSRVGRARSGLGQNKAQGSPAPAAPTPLPAGTDTLLGEGSIGAGASPWLPTFGRAGRLPVPQFPSADVCWVQQNDLQLLVCWGWPQRASLLCSRDAPEVLEGDWSLWGQEGAPMMHESLFSCAWTGRSHKWDLSTLCLWSSSGPSWRAVAVCQDAVESEDSVSGEGWEQDSPRGLPQVLSWPWTLVQPALPPAELWLWCLFL